MKKEKLEYPLETAKLPLTGSKSLHNYESSNAQIDGLIRFVIMNAISLDQTAEQVDKALSLLVVDPQKKAELTSKKSQRKTSVDGLKKIRQILMELILVRHIENFLSYVSSILFEIFITKPEVMKSSEKIEIDKVLEHRSMDTLVKSIAENKVDSLAYSSFYKLSEYISSKLGLDLCDEEDMNTISKYIEVRNISVHNRCLVNDRYLGRTKDLTYKIGDTRVVTLIDVQVLLPRLQSVAVSFDKNVIEKFQVKKTRWKA